MQSVKIAIADLSSAVREAKKAEEDKEREQEKRVADAEKIKLAGMSSDARKVYFLTKSLEKFNVKYTDIGFKSKIDDTDILAKTRIDQIKPTIGIFNEPFAVKEHAVLKQVSETGTGKLKETLQKWNEQCWSKMPAHLPSTSATTTANAPAACAARTLASSGQPPR